MPQLKPRLQTGARSAALIFTLLSIRYFVLSILSLVLIVPQFVLYALQYVSCAPQIVSSVPQPVLATPQSVYAFLNLFCLPLILLCAWLRLFGWFLFKIMPTV